MRGQIIELGSLKPGFRATVVTEYNVLLLLFSFSEMTVAFITHWRCIRVFWTCFYAINFTEVKMPTNFQNIAMQIFKSGLIIQNNLLLHTVY